MEADPLGALNPGVLAAAAAMGRAPAPDKPTLLRPLLALGAPGGGAAPGGGRRALLGVSRPGMPGLAPARAPGAAHDTVLPSLFFGVPRLGK
jgi:hypothetical protein